MSRRLQANLVLVACSLIWGGTFVVVQRALTDVSVFPFLAARFILSAAILFVIARADLRLLTRAQILRGAAIGILMFGGFTFQTAGLLYTSSSKTAFITGFSVVLVPLFVALFWKGHTNAWVIAGALAALIGLYYLTVPSSGFSGFQPGNLLVFACAVMFAFQIIFIARHSPSFSVKALSFLQIATTAVLSTAAIPLLAAVNPASLRFHLNVESILAIVGTAVFATVLAFSMQVWAQSRTTATSAALIFSLEPLFAAITSFIVLHERLGVRTLAGATLILLGIVVVEVKGPAPASVDAIAEWPAGQAGNSGEKDNLEVCKQG
jgi:drug/metabolite transporter (DMT)-like permease